MVSAGVGRMPPWVWAQQGGLPVVLCPTCGFDYNHITSVLVGPINDNREGVEITSDGVKTGPGLRPNAGFGRGVAIEVRMFCESGHRWSLTLAFHKGVTVVQTTGGEPCPLGEPHPVTLWRD